MGAAASSTRLVASFLAFGSLTAEELVSAEIQTGRSRHEKRLTDLSHAFGDRNPKVYEGKLTPES